MKVLPKPHANARTRTRTPTHTHVRRFLSQLSHKIEDNFYTLGPIRTVSYVCVYINSLHPNMINGLLSPVPCVCMMSICMYTERLADLNVTSHLTQFGIYVFSSFLFGFAFFFSLSCLLSCPLLSCVCIYIICCFYFYSCVRFDFSFARDIYVYIHF